MASSYGYRPDTDPEQLVSDYREFFYAQQTAHEEVQTIAQGEKFFKVIDIVDYFGSNDLLTIAIRKYVAASKDLYDHDSQAKSYSSYNLESLIASALEDMNNPTL